MRRKPEDQRVVPFNLATLCIFRAHVNIQDVAENGWQLYLTKYIAKPEPMTKIRYGRQPGQKASDPERFLTCRVTGAVEAIDVLLQFGNKESNVEVIYLPIELTPSSKVIKRKQHLPSDPHSEDIFYNTKFDKYLNRPKELNNVTYPDFYRHYIIRYNRIRRRSKVCDRNYLT